MSVLRYSFTSILYILNLHKCNKNIYILLLYFFLYILNLHKCNKNIYIYYYYIFFNKTLKDIL